MKTLKNRRTHFKTKKGGFWGKNTKVPDELKTNVTETINMMIKVLLKIWLNMPMDEYENNVKSYLFGEDYNTNNIAKYTDNIMINNVLNVVRLKIKDLYCESFNKNVIELKKLETHTTHFKQLYNDTSNTNASTYYASCKDRSNMIDDTFLKLIHVDTTKITLGENEQPNRRVEIRHPRNLPPILNSEISVNMIEDYIQYIVFKLFYNSLDNMLQKHIKPILQTYANDTIYIAKHRLLDEYDKSIKDYVDYMLGPPNVRLYGGNIPDVYSNTIWKNLDKFIYKTYYEEFDKVISTPNLLNPIAQYIHDKSAETIQMLNEKISSNAEIFERQTATFEGMPYSNLTTNIEFYESLPTPMPASTSTPAPVSARLFGDYGQRHFSASELHKISDVVNDLILKNAKPNILEYLKSLKGTPLQHKKYYSALLNYVKTEIYTQVYQQTVLNLVGKTVTTKNIQVVASDIIKAYLERIYLDDYFGS